MDFHGFVYDYKQFKNCINVVMCCLHIRDLQRLYVFIKILRFWNDCDDFEDVIDFKKFGMSVFVKIVNTWLDGLVIGLAL